jgi:hypothetical protein
MSKAISESRQFSIPNLVATGKDITVQTEKGQVKFHQLYYRYKEQEKENFLIIKAPKVYLKFGFRISSRGNEEFVSFSYEEKEEFQDFFLLMKNLEKAFANCIERVKQSLSKIKCVKEFKAEDYENYDRFKKLFWTDENTGLKRLYLQCKPKAENENQRTKFYYFSKTKKGFFEVPWEKVKDKKLVIKPTIRVGWTSIPYHSNAITHKLFVTDVLILEVSEKEQKTSFTDEDAKESSDSLDSFFENIKETDEDFDSFITRKVDKEKQEDEEDEEI